MSTTAEAIRALLTDAPPAVGAADHTPHGAAPDVAAAGGCCALEGDDEFSFACTLPAGHGGNWHVAGDGAEVLAVWGTLGPLW